MIYYVHDIRRPALIVREELDAEHNIHLMIGDNIELPKRTRLICTTKSEQWRLQQAGFYVGYNPNPDHFTINGMADLMAPEEAQEDLQEDLQEDPKEDETEAE